MVAVHRLGDRKYHQRRHDGDGPHEPFPSVHPVSLRLDRQSRSLVAESVAAVGADLRTGKDRIENASQRSSVGLWNSGFWGRLRLAMTGASSAWVHRDRG